MSFTFSQSDTKSGNSTTASTDALTAPSVGDLVVFYVNSNSNSVDPTPDSDAGAAWETHVVDAPSGETCRQAIVWKIANGSEPTTYSWSVGSAEWRTVVYVFSVSGNTPIIDAPINSHIHTSGAVDDLVVGAYDGQVISDYAVGVAFGGKDNRGGNEAYTTANHSYDAGVIGYTTDMMTAGAYRIYTTDGETGSGNVTIETADGQDTLIDYTFSFHVSFIEGPGGGAFPYHSIKERRSDMLTLLTM